MSHHDCVGSICRPIVRQNFFFLFSVSLITLYYADQEPMMISLSSHPTRMSLYTISIQIAHGKHFIICASVRIHNNQIVDRWMCWFAAYARYVRTMVAMCIVYEIEN